MKNWLDFLDKKIAFSKEIVIRKNFSFSVNHNYWVLILIIAPIIAYWSWEIYWYRHVGLAFIKWHTHLMPHFTLGILILISFYYYWSKPSLRNILLSLFTLCLSLFIGESLLLALGIGQTYMEKVTGAYYSLYQSQDKNHHHVWPPGTEHWIRKTGYAFWRPTNSLGFGDMEWPLPKRPGEKRILAMGDSFTEGDGASYDSSFVAFLRRDLTQRDSSVKVMNGGICGSDPFDNYIIYQDLLQKYKPDLIIQSLGSGDMTADLRLRGGLERFQADGTTKYLTAPAWEPLYAISYISRSFFKIAGYDELLQKNRITEAENKRIVNDTKDLFKRYNDLAVSNNAKMIIFLHPERGEVQINRYNYDFTPLLDSIKAVCPIQVVDLLPYYRSYIAISNTSAEDYYWKFDSHHNGKGYRLMEQGIFEKIDPLLKVPTGDKNPVPVQ